MDNAKQFIADMYHCSESWGQKISEDDMLLGLIEWNNEKNPEDYCPAPDLYKECAAYWNELCDAYPS